MLLPDGRSRGQPADARLIGIIGSVRDEVTAHITDQGRTAAHTGAAAAAPEQRRADAERLVSAVLDRHASAEIDAGRPALSGDDERHIVRTVLDGLFGLGGLQPLLEEPDIENINANGCDNVWVSYADGSREQRPPVAESDTDLIDLVRRAAARLGVEERRFDLGSPSLSMQLPDGSRLFAVMAVTGRPCISVRRHRFMKATFDDLIERGTLTEAQAEILRALVRARKNMLITGGAVVGKTTMLRALATAIPPTERLITVEDALELGLDRDHQAHPDTVAMQTRLANTEGQGAIDAAELVRWGLRMSPDRVIVGEARSNEVVPLLNAMSQGNDGSMATVHTSTSQGAFTKIATYAAQSAERLSFEASNLLIASAATMVLHIEMPSPGRRVVASLREVVGADGAQVISNEVWRPGPDRRAEPATPFRETTAEQLAAAGLETRYLRADAGHGEAGWQR